MSWVRRLVLATAVLYPLSLLAVVLALRFIGEAWWASLVGLYLPRIGFALPLPFLCVALGRLRMWRLLSLQTCSVLIILFPLMGLVLPAYARARPDQPRLRVLTYNVNSGRGGVGRILSEIDRYAPDIVLLQETGSHETREGFMRELRARYPLVEILGDFILATRCAPGASGPPPPDDHFLREVLETPLGRLVVYSVHTVSPRHPLFALKGRSELRREASTAPGQAGSPLVDNAAVRASQVMRFASAAAHETDPVILAGDTNLPDLSPVFARFFSSYEDGFTRAGWGFGYTFPTNKGRPWMRIDRILAKGPLQFVGFDIGRDRSASDHLCVVADLQRR